jgi:hypothetical protein
MRSGSQMCIQRNESGNRFMVDLMTGILHYDFNTTSCQ